MSHVEVQNYEVVASSMPPEKVFNDMDFLISSVNTFRTAKHRLLAALIFHVACDSGLSPVQPGAIRTFVTVAENTCKIKTNMRQAISR